MLLILSAWLSLPAAAQSGTLAGYTILVVPFENASKSPGIEWIGEAFSDVLGQRLSAAQLFVIRRKDRLYAFDRLGVPVNIRPSRATLYRVAEEMDVDYVVVGSYTFDGRNFTARAQLLDMAKIRLSPEAVESGGLPQLGEIQNAIAWDMLHDLDLMFPTSKNQYLQASPTVRLDALENYIRGAMATQTSDKVKYFKEAIRLTPDYWQAVLQLARTYFDAREYDPAVLWFAKIPKTDSMASEANFFLGLSYYYKGDFEKAEEAFSFVAGRVPLTEVFNDIGVVAARLGEKRALRYFQHAAEADPQDADYRFNLALALDGSGNKAEALRELKDAASLKPQDTEIKTLLEQWSAPAQASESGAKAPLERIKRNYDETSYQQLAMEIKNANEERYSKLPPAEHAASHVKQGEESLKHGLVEQAEAEFREATQLDPSNVEAHLGLARALEERHQLAEARTQAVEANRLKLSADSFLLLARLDIKENKLDSARENINRALQIDGNNAIALEMKRAMVEGKK